MRLPRTPFPAVCCGMLWAVGVVPAAGQAESPSPKQIDQLILQLGSDDFEAREAASKELKDMGEPALPALRKAVQSGDAESRRRAQELVRAIERPLVEKARASLEALGANIWRHRDQPEFLRIEIHTDKTSDADLAQLKYFGDIGYLTIEGGQATDAGLAVLENLPNLRELNLYCPKMTDAGLAHVKGLRNLTGLGLGSPKITDAGLVHLKDLRSLEILGWAATESRTTDWPVWKTWPK